jgi:hypothetical protein
MNWTEEGGSLAQHEVEQSCHAEIPFLHGRPKDRTEVKIGNANTGMPRDPPLSGKVPGHRQPARTAGRTGTSAAQGFHHRARRSRDQLVPRQRQPVPDNDTSSIDRFPREVEKTGFAKANTQDPGARGRRDRHLKPSKQPETSVDPVSPRGETWFPSNSSRARTWTRHRSLLQGRDEIRIGMIPERSHTSLPVKEDKHVTRRKSHVLQHARTEEPALKEQFPYCRGKPSMNAARRVGPGG